MIVKDIRCSSEFRPVRLQGERLQPSKTPRPRIDEGRITITNDVLVLDGKVEYAADRFEIDAVFNMMFGSFTPGNCRFPLLALSIHKIGSVLSRD